MDEVELKVLKEKSKKGDSESSFALAKHFESIGKQHKALHYYKKAGDKGHSKAQKILGMHFLSKTNPDYPKAVDWLTLASAQDEVEAMWELAWIYENGIGVLKDTKKANYWFSVAAEMCYPQAEYRLGVIYEEGHGVKQSDKKALHYYLRSARHGLIEGMYRVSLFMEKGRGIGRSVNEANYWKKKAITLDLERNRKRLESMKGNQDKKEGEGPIENTEKPSED